MDSAKTEIQQKKKRGAPEKYLFKPGQSGNPAGRPKGSISLTETIKRKLQVLLPGQKREAIEVLADNIIRDALDDSDNMRKLIWNYVDGMPPQKTDITSNNETIQPLLVRILNEKDNGDSGGI